MSSQPARQTPFDLDAVFEVEDYLYFYGDDLTDERSEAEVASLATLLELTSPLRILDLACGFGRHTNRFAAMGHTVVGLDLMPGFLAIARQQAAALGVQVDYQQGDMRDIPFHAEFDRVLLLFTSFGYFDDADNVRVLENMARALKPGGLLGFDIPNRDVTAAEPPTASVIDKNGDLMVNRLSFDIHTGRYHNRRIVIRDGIRKDKPFSIRLYNAQEIRALLDRVGLEVYKLVAADGQTLTAQSRRMMVVARKPC